MGRHARFCHAARATQRTCSVAVSLRSTLLGEAGAGPATAAISTAARGGAAPAAPVRAVPPLLLRRVLASAVRLMPLMTVGWAGSTM